MPASHILLFDIDGTLLRTGGAGMQAMARAFERLYGVADAFAGIDMGGRSDSWILQSALAQQGLPHEPAVRERFAQAYAEALAETLPLFDGQIMPGIPALLEALAEAAVVRGLGTGNFRRTSLLKLRHFGLAEHFLDGGFGGGLGGSAGDSGVGSGAAAGGGAGGCGGSGDWRHDARHRGGAGDRGAGGGGGDGAGVGGGVGRGRRGRGAAGLRGPGGGVSGDLGLSAPCRDQR